tara:strand:- start:1793 stop:2380 length:588 start_codon:yes stop_codon:yes gene_type:complete
MKLGKIDTVKKEASTAFQLKNNNLDFNLIDFWTWNQSDLIENRTRGILAEFIVMKALGIVSSIRVEWDPYDLKTLEGYKIEIKSAAYIQTWEQNDFSTISFDIKPTKPFNNNSYSGTKTRPSDVYVFCLLHHKNQQSINPMMLEQWTFFIVSTKYLNTNLPEQKSIGLATIKNLTHEQCTYIDLKKGIDKVMTDS